MRIEKFICDRCGKEIENKKLHRLEIYDDSQNNWFITSDNDFCEDCARKIAEFALLKQISGKTVKEIPAPEQNPPDAKKTINELIEEGKTTDEIVSIKNCSKASVYTARYQINKQKNKRKESGEVQEHEQPKEESKLDVGKINALWKANWSIPKIANEMGVCDGVIASILKVELNTGCDIDVGGYIE